MSCVLGGTLTVFRVDRQKYKIQIPLPAKIDASVTMMTVEEKPDVTYEDVGGCKEQIDRLREVVELPLLKPERFVSLGIDPPKGVLLFGPPGTGKTVSFTVSLDLIWISSQPELWQIEPMRASLE